MDDDLHPDRAPHAGGGMEGVPCRLHRGEPAARQDAWVPDEVDPGPGGAELEAILATCPFPDDEMPDERELLADLQVWRAEQTWPDALCPEEQEDCGPLLPAFLVDDIAAGVPGPRVVADLVLFEPERADAYTVVEAMAAWRKVEAMAAARVRALAAELSGRPEMRMSRPPAITGRTVDPVVTAEEIAPRLGVSRRQARRLVRVGHAMNGVGIPTGDALVRGEIDAAKADMIVEAVAGLSPCVALQVQDEVLERASRRTHYQVQQDLTRALAHTDPADFAVRHAEALKERRVSRSRPLPDGMASQTIVWDATNATALDLALDGAARSAKNDGDTRTLDQLRADALGLMVHTSLAAGHIGRASPTTTEPPGPTTDVEPFDTSPVPPPDAAPPAQAAAPAPEPGLDLPPPPHGMRIGVLGGRRAEIRVTVPLSTAMGGDEPGELEGYGPVPAAVARAIAAGGTWRRLVTDPVTDKVVDYGSTRYRPPQAMADRIMVNKPECTAPTCSRPAHLCDLNHRIPFPLGHTSDENLDPMCRRDHVLCTHGGFSYVAIGEAGYEWTTPTGHRYRRSPDGALAVLPRTSDGAWGDEVPADGPIPF